jgi:hypothetical protein
MDDEERTFKKLKGIDRDGIEDIIMNVKIRARELKDYDLASREIDKELAPYGWSLKKYYEYFF